ncbi:helix-turn-helix domain-containing protein [Algibacter luteus]|uniref:helix-turn-helix domain-containing protein n=1 Tax=Algibacter luteus TaxID=1178825 RepID=UPI002596A8AC|nr:AraC family transcriptional regulator [Algibacter luteus]WJJ96412.1 AraC family transcriptional regulator [Algibacter luteus]
MNEVIYIKNMVCPRCILAVSNILQERDIPYVAIKLGEVELTKPLSVETKNLFSKALQDSGFSLINDRKSQLIEQMKTLVVDKIHHSSEELDIKLADYISEKLHLDYKYLSSLFSSVESITFEQYIINQKIERTKELIVYDELTLSEIAFKLNYSSVAYLSNQFKKVTGMTPTQFKNSINKNRKSLDDF